MSNWSGMSKCIAFKDSVPANAIPQSNLSMGSSSQWYITFEKGKQKEVPPDQVEANSNKRQWSSAFQNQTSITPSSSSLAHITKKLKTVAPKQFIWEISLEGPEILLSILVCLSCQKAVHPGYLREHLMRNHPDAESLNKKTSTILVIRNYSHALHKNDSFS